MLQEFRFDGTRILDLTQAATGAGLYADDKKALKAKTDGNLEKLAVLQEKLYADGHEGLIVVLQAMDAAGKDSTIKHVMTGMNPQGVRVHPFKAPNSAELKHDYLWRVAKCLPARGEIAIFNRSHYEDCVAVRVRHLENGLGLPGRCLTGDDFFVRRYRQIVDFEKYLYENGVRMVKIFLNVSEKEQKKRFLERLNNPEKNWKFSKSDLDDRALWDDFLKAYEDAINATATACAPWYVLPADNKWFTRYLVSEILVRTLEDMDPRYPVMPAELEEEIPELVARLENE
ncbi:MAG: polyphosphate kinase 2 family protein [Clostridia bacterium]|nr:polyphosphate kinase 2 family protein [Clostridia bacterium]